MRRLQERGPVPALRARRLALAGAVAAAVTTADQLTKAWALRALDEGPIHLIWTLRLDLSFNSGAAFGLGRGLAPVLTAVAILLVLALLGFGRAALATLPGTVALGLVLGGALGNLADRLFGHHDGSVVDFIDLRWWPVFNLADAAISCGVVLLLVSSWHRPRQRTPTP
ncbi:MAG: signal peptidase II [Actinomycetota bacterium]|nr:signal peptidase II [Actinomycetota bacterium]